MINGLWFQQEEETHSKDSAFKVVIAYFLCTLKVFWVGENYLCEKYTVINLLASHVVYVLIFHYTKTKDE